MKRVCVKRLKSAKTHLADVLARSIEDGWEYNNRKFTGIETPLVGICGTTINSGLNVAEVVDGPPTCQLCLHRSNTPIDKE